MKEIEARFLEVDIDDIRSKLKKLKAKKVHPLMLYRRYTFKLQNPNEKGYARVRQEASGTTMTIKKYGANKYAMEYEVALKDTSLEDARDFMLGAGFVQLAYHETLREKYKHPKVNEVVIDVLPGLPPYIEIEAQTEANMKYMCEKLGLNMENAEYGSYGKQYTDYYGIPETVFNSIAEMRFETVDKFFLKHAKKNKDFLKKVKKSNLILYKAVMKKNKNKKM